MPRTKSFSTHVAALLAAGCVTVFSSFLPENLAGSVASAQVRLPEIISDHMVLQQEKDLPIWGWAEPGETVTVTAGTGKATVVTGKDGAWMVKLPPMPPTETPFEVTIAGTNTIVLHDVVVGDVWVCSGQSNMEMGIGADAAAKTEIPKANYPLIRLFYVPKMPAPSPQTTLNFGNPKAEKSRWILVTPESLMIPNTWFGFSAVGFYFGREIHDFTHHPVGLIGTYWGGTPAQSWTSEATLAGNPILADFAKSAASNRVNYDAMMARYNAEVATFQDRLKKWETETATAAAAYKKANDDWLSHASDMDVDPKPAPVKPVVPPQPKMPGNPSMNAWVPSSLYNGMIAPLVPYAIKGAIWYQGESNAGDPINYRTLFPAMITDWRKNWGQGDFPFFYVQLANFMAVKPEPTDSSWAGLREAQTRTLTLPNTGMAVIIDIGDAADIHPRDKWDVGLRLAEAAKHVAYGKNLVYTGPMFKSMKIDGSKIRVSFEPGSVGSGLTIGKPPEHFPAAHAAGPKIAGFAIAGADDHFVWADAVIENDTIIVSSPDVPSPTNVRYGWADNPIVNLYNKEGLPASPFRTDDLPIIRVVAPAPSNAPTPATPATKVAPAPSAPSAVPAAPGTPVVPTFP